MLPFYTYIIGHYNPSFRIIDLVSHTTYVWCVLILCLSVRILTWNMFDVFVRIYLCRVYCVHIASCCIRFRYLFHSHYLCFCSFCLLFSFEMLLGHFHLHILEFVCDLYLFCASCICWVMWRVEINNIIHVVKYDEYFKLWIWLERGFIIWK